MRIKVTNPQGKQTGYIQNGVYYRTLRDAHILRTPPAIAISLDVLDQLTRHGVSRLVFRHEVTGVCYRATLAHFVDKALTIERGYGRQLALPLAGWTVETRGGAILNPHTAPADRPEQIAAAAQLTFLGGGR